MTTENGTIYCANCHNMIWDDEGPVCLQEPEEERWYDVGPAPIKRRRSGLKEVDGRVLSHEPAQPGGLVHERCYVPKIKTLTLVERPRRII